MHWNILFTELFSKDTLILSHQSKENPLLLPFERREHTRRVLNSVGTDLCILDRYFVVFYLQSCYVKAKDMYYGEKRSTGSKFVL